VVNYLRNHSKTQQTSTMSWIMTLYVIDKSIDHNESMICHQLNYEPEEEDKCMKVDNHSHKIICPKCLWYLARWVSNPTFVVANMSFHHPYLKPLVAYDWSLRGKWKIGDFVDLNEYDVTNEITTWNLQQVLRAETSIMSLAEPTSDCDINTRQQTITSLRWARHWLEKNKNFIIITDADDNY